MGSRYLKTEDEVLFSDYPTASREKILEKIPNRTWPQLSAHARRRGIHRATEAKGDSIREGRKELRGSWTNAENDRFRRLYPVMSQKLLLDAFPKRSMSALSSHAYTLKVRRTREAKACAVEIGRRNVREATVKDSLTVQKEGEVGR